jgi:hypothetical protein
MGIDSEADYYFHKSVENDTTTYRDDILSKVYYSVSLRKNGNVSQADDFFKQTMVGVDRIKNFWK